MRFLYCGGGGSSSGDDNSSRSTSNTTTNNYDFTSADNLANASNLNINKVNIAGNNNNVTTTDYGAIKGAAEVVGLAIDTNSKITQQTITGNQKALETAASLAENAIDTSLQTVNNTLSQGLSQVKALTTNQNTDLANNVIKLIAIGAVLTAGVIIYLKTKRG